MAPAFLLGGTLIPRGPRCPAKPPGREGAEMRSKLKLVTLAIALAVLGGAMPAAAGDRPVNGQISFARFDPALGDWSI
jgi:hypothetical protein